VVAIALAKTSPDREADEESDGNIRFPNHCAHCNKAKVKDWVDVTRSIAPETLLTQGVGARRGASPLPSPFTNKKNNGPMVSHHLST